MFPLHNLIFQEKLKSGCMPSEHLHPIYQIVSLVYQRFPGIFEPAKMKKPLYQGLWKQAKLKGATADCINAVAPLCLLIAGWIQFNFSSENAPTGSATGSKWTHCFWQHFYLFTYHRKWSNFLLRNGIHYFLLCDIPPPTKASIQQLLSQNCPRWNNKKRPAGSRLNRPVLWILD